MQLLTPSELHARFDWLNTDDLAGASLGLADEGWFDAYALLQGFRRKARSLGVEERIGEVVGLERDGATLAGVRLADGSVIDAGWVGTRPARARRRLPAWPASSCPFDHGSDTSTTWRRRSASARRH